MAVTNLRHLAKNALQVQNASNILGLSKSYARDLQDLADTLRSLGLPSHTDAICYHCINQLWASKLHNLAGIGMTRCDVFGIAYEECQKLARGD